MLDGILGNRRISTAIVFNHASLNRLFAIILIMSNGGILSSVRNFAMLFTFEVGDNLRHWAELITIEGENYWDARRSACEIYAAKYGVPLANVGAIERRSRDRLSVKQRVFELFNRGLQPEQILSELPELNWNTLNTYYSRWKAGEPP